MNVSVKSAYVFCEFGKKKRRMTMGLFDLISERDSFVSAAGIGNIIEVERIITQGKIPIDHVDGLGRTALHAALVQNRVNVVLLLLKCGADPKKPRRDGFTPLYIARNNKELVELLKQYGA